MDNHPLHTDHYYHMLDLGIPLTATAGSDFPWCGQDHGHGPPERSSRIGNARFYTFLNGPLTYANWHRAVRAGHTFVSSGPMLDLRVTAAGYPPAMPGNQLDVGQGSSPMIIVHAYGHDKQTPLDTLELVSHGRVIGRVTAHEAGQSARHLSLTLTLPPLRRGQWIAARCTAGPGQAAHTTPVYVVVEGGGFHNPETAGQYLDLSERYLQEIEQVISQPGTAVEQQAWRYADGLRTRIAEVRQLIAKKRVELR